MKISELREWVDRRLGRKAKQAEKAYIAEFTVKSTVNCSNHGIRLSEGTFHCRINAMGLHERGASQCWNGKARVCPVFELFRDIESLKRDFRKMRPNQVALRWPSLGELIRFKHMLSLIEVDSYGDVESEMHQSENRLPLSEDETGTGLADGNVRGEYRSGCSYSTSSNQTGIDAGGKPDSRGPEFDAGNSSGLSMANLGRSRDGDKSD